MRVPTSILLAVLLSVPTLAAPVLEFVERDESGLAVRAVKKVAARPKPVVKAPVRKPVAKPVVKAPVKKTVPKKTTTVKKPVAKPVAKKPVAKPKTTVKAAAKPKATVKAAAKPKVVATKKAVATAKKVAATPTATKKATVAAKKPVVPAKKPTVTASKKAVAAKPKTTVAAKKTTTAAAKKTTPAKSCPLPVKKTTVRRFLEYVGFARTTTPDPACSSATTPTTSTTAASKSEAKAAAKAAKAAKAASKSAAAVAAAASAEAGKRPVGAVADPPTGAVKCTNSGGTLTEIPLASIQTAIRLAQAGPLIAGKNAAKFPHVFDNREGVDVNAACKGKVLEEHTVGVSMAAFKNIPSVISTAAFNQFRVLITTPSSTGATTFCGVMTHGLSTTGTFEKALCAAA